MLEALINTEVSDTKARDHEWSDLPVAYKTGLLTQADVDLLVRSVAERLVRRVRTRGTWRANRFTMLRSTEGLAETFDRLMTGL